MYVCEVRPRGIVLFKGDWDPSCKARIDIHLAERITKFIARLSGVERSSDGGDPFERAFSSGDGPAVARLAVYLADLFRSDGCEHLIRVFGLKTSEPFR